MKREFFVKIKKNNLFRNCLVLIGGEGINSIISLITLSIQTLSIGLVGTGTLTVLSTYSNMFNGIFNFQSYNSVIKFGSEAIESKNSSLLKKYIKQAFIQDILTAIIAYFAGNLMLNTLSNVFDWSIEITYLMRLYMITILFNINGWGLGVLRLLNEFKMTVIATTISNTVKLTMFLIGLFCDLSLSYFMISEIISIAINTIVVYFYVFKILRTRGYGDFYRVKIYFDKTFTTFNLYNNIVSTIDIPVSQLTVFIINTFLGVSEVGIYSILSKLAAIISKVTTPVSQVLLPEISRLIAKGENDRAFMVVRKIFILTLGTGGSFVILISLTSALWMKYFIPYNMYNLFITILYFVYIILSNSAMGIHLLFISMNLVKYNLPIVLIINICYLFIVFNLAKNYGLVGIIISLILQCLAVAVLKYRIIIERYRKDIEKRKNDAYSFCK